MGPLLPDRSRGCPKQLLLRCRKAIFLARARVPLVSWVVVWRLVLPPGILRSGGSACGDFRLCTDSTCTEYHKSLGRWSDKCIQKVFGRYPHIGLGKWR